MKKLAFIAAIGLMFSSCSSNQMAKSFGGSTTVNLPSGQKLVNVTWKVEADIWYLTRPMTATDTLQTYTFTQDKGSLIHLTGNGVVTIIESK